MKKFVYLLFFVFLLTGCALDVKDEGTDDLQSINKLDAYSDASILYYKDNKIYFYEIIMNNIRNSSDFELFEYDLSSGIIKQLGRINDFHTTTNSIVSTDKGFVFTVCTYNEENFINNLYYYQDDALINIYSWNANIPMSYIYKVTNEEVLLFSPDSIVIETDEYYSYKISKISLISKKGEEIKTFYYNITEGMGEIVPTIDFYNNQVCLIKNIVKEGTDTYYLCSYDIKGNELWTTEVDIKDFLYLESTSSNDSIYKLECLENNILVLQTLNSRIIMFERVGNNLVKINIPDKLSDFPEGYKFAKYYGEGRSVAYFINKYSDNLIKIDTYSNVFNNLNINSISSEDYISAVNINSQGNILMKVNGKFYLSKENEYELLEDYSLFQQEKNETISSSQKITEEESKTEHNITERTNYNLEEITQKRYEKAGSYIEFSELPENDAETIVCYALLYKILGTNYKIHQFEYNASEFYEETSNVEKQSVYEWIEVTELETMEFEDLKKQEGYGNLFEQLREKLAPKMQLDDYVRMILDNGCAVVFIRYEDKYTEEYNVSLPQNPDGLHEQFWLFVPDENNQLRIFDNTQIFGLFNFRNKNNVPDSLILNVKRIIAGTLFDAMKITLPEGISVGKFDRYLEQGGGVPILNSKGEEVGIIGIHRITEGIFEQGNLVAAETHENHAIFTTEFEKINSELPGVIAGYSRDHGENPNVWYAFWAKEGMEPVYAVSLYEQYFTYDEAVNIVESVVFLDEAFKKPAEDVVDDWGQQFTD